MLDRAKFSGFSWLMLVLLLIGNQAIASQDNCYLWEVKSAESRVYLLGSVHMMKQSMYPLDGCIDDAYNKADKLVVELNMLALDQKRLAQLMQQKGVFPNGMSLDNQLTSKTMDMLHDYLQSRGIAYDQVKMLRPWYLGLMLTLNETSHLGYSGEIGVDVYLLNKANGIKPVLELETLESQLEILSGDTAKEQDLSLRIALEDMPKLGSYLELMLELWQHGDAEGLDKIMREPVDRYPELQAAYERLLNERNQKMVEKIKVYLADKSDYLVVVGGGHIGGTGGVLNLLGKAGYQVRQLPRQGASMLTY